MIDRARVVAVCEDVRQASTALSGGLDDAGVDRFLVAAADLLDRPPLIASAAALSRTLRTADRQAGVTAGLAWCTAQHG